MKSVSWGEVVHSIITEFYEMSTIPLTFQQWLDFVLDSRRGGVYTFTLYTSCLLFRISLPKRSKNWGISWSVGWLVGW